MAEYERGLRLAPDDVELLSAPATAEARLQRWDGHRPAARTRALRLDPRSTTVARRLATVNLFLRQYAAADSAVDRAIALAPDQSRRWCSLKVMVAVAGAISPARARWSARRGRIDATTLFRFPRHLPGPVLGARRARSSSEVLEVPPSAFDDDRGVWGIVRSELHQLRGDRRRAAAYADSARLPLEAQSRAAPDDGQRHALLGLALAYLGRKAEAMREGRRGVALLPVSATASWAPTSSSSW